MLNREKNALEQPSITTFFTDFGTFYAMYYPMMQTCTLGHEIGHAMFPYLYGEKVKIRIHFLGGGSVTYSTKNLPAKLMPVISALGPISGVLTSFGILKASNIYNEFKKNKNIKDALYQGMQTPLLNEIHHSGIVSGAIICSTANAMNFYRWPGYEFFNKNPRIPTDGEYICDYFRFSGKKAFLARHTMFFASVGLIGRALDLYKINNNKVEINKDNLNCVAKSFNLKLS